MTYEINVSKDGIHFFATHERSLYSIDKLNQAVKVFKEKFPESEGYKISASVVRTTKEDIEIWTSK